jgi:hypothetical protein
MCKTVFPFGAAIVVLLWLSFGSAAPRKDAGAKEDALAEEAVKEFHKALVAKDVDGVLAVSDVPFYWAPEEPRVDRERLRTLLKKLFRDKDYTGAKHTIVETTTYGELAPTLDKKQKDALDQVALHKDRVVFVKDAASGSEKVSPSLVRVRDGKAKVIGMFYY